jgi:hypothetical protein
MELRSKYVKKVDAALIKAAADGFALKASEIRRIIPPERVVAAVVWEYRRWGGKTVAIKQGKHVLGYLLVKPLPDEPKRRATPTNQTVKRVKAGEQYFRPAVRKVKPAQVSTVETSNSIEQVAA